MAVTEKTGGSQTATLGTEHPLATVTDAGIYQLRVFLTNLAAGDIVLLRIYVKARNATDAEGVIYEKTYGPIVPNEKYADSIAVQSAGHFKATLQQTDGTGRVWAWVILSSGA